MISFILLNLFFVSSQFSFVAPKRCVAFGRIEEYKDPRHSKYRNQYMTKLERRKIVFDISNLETKEDEEAITNAMKTIEYQTCIRFVREPDNMLANDPKEDRPLKNNYICIDSKMWCYQRVTPVQNFGCLLNPNKEPVRNLSKGLVVHMLLRAIGLEAEHLRKDRNKYITINWDNIIDGREHEYFKTEISLLNFNKEYDYKSILHFTPDILAKNSTIPVITPKKCDIKMGDIGWGLKNVKFTDLDIYKIEKLYGCQ